MPWRMVGEGPLVQTPPPRLGNGNADQRLQRTRT
jgi:hypothetical protein